jgi:hypothetical protein
MLPMPTWHEKEEALHARLREGKRGAARALLLAELAAYAQDVVRAARAEPGRVIPPAELAQATRWLERPVFICGHHRSGTTLLQELLDGHPELVVLPSEGTYFTSFRRVARADPEAQALDAFAAEWVSRLVDPNYPPHFKLGRSTADHQPYVTFVRSLFAWQRELPMALPRLAQFGTLLALVAAYREVALPGVAPNLWVEKTPLNERYRSKFAAFDNALFIHVVRHPADSFASLMQALRQGGVANPPRAAHAADIGHSLLLAAENSARHEGRYLVVRYEDLTASPAREMERVRAFLKIAGHDTLTRATSGGIAVAPNSSFGVGTAGEVVKPGKRAELTPEDSELLATYAGEAARLHGYELVPLASWRRTMIRLRHAPSEAVRRLRIALR